MAMKDNSKLRKLFDKDRNYVIVCNTHKDSIEDYLLFLGWYTKYDKPRNFEGYTRDLNKCERYSLEEIKENKFPIYGIDLDFYNHEEFSDFAINIDKLDQLECRSMLVYMKF